MPPAVGARDRNHWTAVSGLQKKLIEKYRAFPDTRSVHPHGLPYYFYFVLVLHICFK